MSLKVTFLNSAIYGNKNRESVPQSEGSSGFKTAANPLHSTPHHLSNIVRYLHQQKAKDFLSPTATKFRKSHKSDDDTDDDVSIYFGSPAVGDWYHTYSILKASEGITQNIEWRHYNRAC